MNDKDAEEIKAQLRRIQRENYDRSERARTWVIVAIVVVVIAYALWNNQRINGNTPDPGSAVDCSSQPYSVNC